tara:strand:+ start:1067 stop:1630 length:564 start_codon:yes stop_codon:yes gene_type:complete
MEDIEKELEEKSIERDVQVQITELEPEVIEEAPIPEAVQAPAPVKKVKKARSEKQIAAFEKARLKRAEGIASRKKDKEEQKELKKEVKKQEKKLQDVAIVQEQTIPKPVVNTPTSKEQVIQNHYYYYGVPPPNHDYTEPKKKKKKSKRPPTPSSSESESSEEEEYEVKPQVAPLKQYQPPKYQFSYA